MMRAPSNKSTLYEPSTFEIISALYRFHEPGNVPSRYSRLDDMIQFVNATQGKTIKIWHFYGPDRPSSFDLCASKESTDLVVTSVEIQTSIRSFS
jgi:hypothetical protein